MSESGRPKSKGPLRVPAIVVVPIGAAVGYAVASWLGGILGLAIGIVLWRSRV